MNLNALSSYPGDISLFDAKRVVFSPNSLTYEDKKLLFWFLYNFFRFLDNKLGF